MKDSHEFTGSPGGWSIVATFPDLLMRARRFMDPSGELLTVLVVLAACGGDPVTVTTNAEKAEPKPALVGTVIASGAFDITPVPVPTIGDPDFLIARRFEGNLSANLAPTAGKLLVLSVREVLDALECPTAIFITECATMVVLEQDGPEPGRRPGRLTVSLPDPFTYYPWGSFELRPEAEDI